VYEDKVTYETTGQTVSLPKLDGCFELSEHQSVYFLLRQPDDGHASSSSWDELEGLLQSTSEYWHRWISGCTYKGRWREMVERSALVLKLMTFAPTGAIIAAPTLSLPEEIGGGKNWDYRFTWIRDAAFTVYAFLRIGLTTEAADFMTWIERRCRDILPDDPVGLRLMYDIHGRHPTVEVNGMMGESVLAGEVELSHWTGYRNSQPVRIGNLAALQQQLDIYGELMDAIYLCDKYVRPVSWDFWTIIRDRIIPQVLRRWNEPDHGIWEARDEPQHHVYSKMMAWVALDRAARLAAKRSLPAPPQWLEVRNEIYESVMAGGYNEKQGVFTQYYGGDSLDASTLVMPLVFFISPDDPRFLRTLERSLLPPKFGGLTVNHLVFRYHPGVDRDPEGTFTICSFWVVEALARAGTRHPRLLKEGRLMFEDIIGYANHLGLFAEELGLDGSAMGNFPQAFTHLSLISAAFNLDRALG
jgi:GH15 family glucan-1,4-alpha-glucosidase